MAPDGRTHRAAFRGLIFSEVVVGLPLLALVAALATGGILTYQKSRSEAMARQAAMWAAAAQMERIQAGAEPASPPPAGVLPADLIVNATSAPGQGQWQGFQFVTVTASVRLNDRRTVTERISGYVKPPPAAADRPGDERSAPASSTSSSSTGDAFRPADGREAVPLITGDSNPFLFAPQFDFLCLAPRPADQTQESHP